MRCAPLGRLRENRDQRQEIETGSIKHKGPMNRPYTCLSHGARLFIANPPGSRLWHFYFNLSRRSWQPALAWSCLIAQVPWLARCGSLIGPCPAQWFSRERLRSVFRRHNDGVEIGEQALLHGRHAQRRGAQVLAHRSLYELRGVLLPGHGWRRMSFEKTAVGARRCPCCARGAQARRAGRGATYL